jgi:hypothetical protein
LWTNADRNQVETGFRVRKLAPVDARIHKGSEANAMATKIKSTIVKNTAKQSKTSAPKVSRTRANDSVTLRRPEHDEIAMRAYERFCARGGEHGHDVEDWLAAEHELASR